MSGCIFSLMVLGLGFDSDTPKNVEVWDCGSELKYTVEKKEVFIYDTLIDKEFYVYKEKM